MSEHNNSVESEGEGASQQYNLTIEQTRVLGSLVEKHLTTPEQYPLTANALLLACNQKSSRHPKMNMTLRAVLDAVNLLEQDKWIQREYSVRTDRFSHRMLMRLKLEKSEMVALTIMLLRGPQTFGEIRSHSGRMYEFEDLTEVELVVDSLIDRGLVVKSPPIPGKREVRYQHTLSPADQIPDIECHHSVQTVAHEKATDFEEIIEQLQQRITALEQFVSEKFDDFPAEPNE